MRHKRTLFIMLALFTLYARGAGATSQDDFFSKMIVESDIPGIQRAINDGYDVNRIITFDRYQYQPLAIAVHRCQPEVVRVLLESGADPNSTGMNGTNALLLSIAMTRASDLKDRENAVSIFDILLSRGANPNCYDEFGTTPLTSATLHSDDKISLYLVQKLLKAGADANLRREGDITPLFMAITAGYRETAPSAERLEVISLLLSAGANPNAQIEGGATPLHAAVFNLSIVKILVSAGANPEMVDEKGQTALDWAKGLGPVYGANKDVQFFLQKSEKK